MIDGQMVITGSFNSTRAAEHNNAENLLVVQDAEMAAKYAQSSLAARPVGAHSRHRTFLAHKGSPTPSAWSPATRAKPARGSCCTAWAAGVSIFWTHGFVLLRLLPPANLLIPAKSCSEGVRCKSVAPNVAD